MEKIMVQISADDLTLLTCRITCKELAIKRLEEENKKLKKQLEEKENQE